MFAEQLREMMSRFPTGVAIVTCLDPGGKPFGMTCSSLVSVCLKPPVLLVSLRTASATSTAVGRRASFAVNLLGVGGEQVARLFASPTAERFLRVRWRRSAGGLPWLVEHVVAVAECKVTKRVAVGDHTVVFGEVVDIALLQPASPLLYGMRQFAEWTAAKSLSASEGFSALGRRDPGMVV